MSSIKGIQSGSGQDPYESIKNVGNQTPVDSTQNVSESQPQSSVEQPEELRDKEKKGMEQLAAERIAEEQIKAQLKKTELVDQLDSTQPTTDAAAPDNQRKDFSRFDYHDPDNQPVPFRGPNGELQRWDVADKKWK